MVEPAWCDTEILHNDAVVGLVGQLYELEQHVLSSDCLGETFPVEAKELCSAVLPSPSHPERRRTSEEVGTPEQ